MNHDLDSKRAGASQRIDIIDALRGSALFGILLLHSVEHWDFMRPPGHRPPWLAALDGRVTEAAYFRIGQAAKWWWTIETFRYPQMLGLFTCGLLIGRSGVVRDAQRLRQAGRLALVLGALGFALVALARSCIGTLGLTGMRQIIVGELVSAYANLAQAALWTGGFVLLYGSPRTAALLQVFVPYGRMSLTCYVTQAVVGVPFFYGFGVARTA